MFAHSIIAPMFCFSIIMAGNAASSVRIDFRYSQMVSMSGNEESDKIDWMENKTEPDLTISKKSLERFRISLEKRKDRNRIELSIFRFSFFTFRFFIHHHEIFDA